MYNTSKTGTSGIDLWLLRQILFCIQIASFCQWEFWETNKL